MVNDTEFLEQIKNFTIDAEVQNKILAIVAESESKQFLSFFKSFLKGLFNIKVKK